MIRINLLPVKRKKKAKPLPTFVIGVTFIGLFLAAVLLYLYFYFDSNMKSAEAQFETNKGKIAELKKRIKEVDDYENLNKTFDERNKIIEHLRKNQNIPARMLDDISKALPNGVWLNSMAVQGDAVTLEGYAFSNSDVVAYVENLKNTKKFTDIFLQETKQTEIEKIAVYSYKLTLKVVA
ncbi:MAG TPA: PilN domain-containing protein [Thermodesulfovibrionales bacterium]|jgi:type IV pilus assembly protein PilN|nr:PilN domain-containing protein [Thermodesulfovibrionales bacterium]